MKSLELGEESPWLLLEDVEFLWWDENLECR